MEGRMNWDQIEGRWKEFAGAARCRWRKLSDSELRQIKGHRSELAGRIVNAYGVTRQEAERQIDAWANSR